MNSKERVKAALKAHLEAELRATDAAVAALAGMDFSPTTEVRPGAIVVLDGDHYVVGVISSAFECDGVTYEGMATDALLYEAIKGLQTGDTFTFAGMDYHLDSVS
ncbi:hypothetical protein [Kribbella sp. NPDC048928]|uniref:hypothetical protein n=1 Tax=Kribbella sp. NPDC048928 TaxID=3364111 RepID=UPI00371AA3F6